MADPPLLKQLQRIERDNETRRSDDRRENKYPECVSNDYLHNALSHEAMTLLKACCRKSASYNVSATA